MLKQFEYWKEYLTLIRHRQLLAITGSLENCIEQVEPLLNIFCKSLGACVGLKLDNISSISFKETPQWLGRENHFVIFNALNHFDEDAFGIMSGTVIAGGIFFLLTPELTTWHTHESSRYIQRLSKLLQHSNEVCHLNDILTYYPINQKNHQLQQNKIHSTTEQKEAIQAIIKVATGHRKRPFVLTADRGRGKSTALGIATAMLSKSIKRIAITAPTFLSVEKVFHHAKLLIKGSYYQNNQLIWETGCLFYISPNKILDLHYDIECNLFFVDEAAALSVSMLTNLLKKNSRIVFSSTIHGYEGSGKGFAIRFNSTLNQLTPHWKALHLKEPIRWAYNDPLENFVSQALMLNANPVDSFDITAATPKNTQWFHFNKDTLIQNEQRQQEIFGLLTLAHYRTRPLDIRYALDSPNVEIFGMLYKEKVIAILFMSSEGNINSQWQHDIYIGKKRLKGHLLPQSLSNHIGIPDAISLKAMRIMRIAVHPSLRRKGFARTMIKKIYSHAKNTQIDYIGVSYGVSFDLLSFWLNCQFQPIKLGVQKNRISGSYSLLMLMPISSKGEKLANQGNLYFIDSFFLQLAESKKEISAYIVVNTLRYSPSFKPQQLSLNDWQQIESFINGQRLYHNCLASIHRLLLYAIKYSSQLHLLNQLTKKILLHMPWSQWIQIQIIANQQEALILFKQSIEALKKELFFV